MKAIFVAVGVMLLLCAASTGAQSRACGDLDESGSVNIGDLAAMFDYLVFGGGSFDPANGECDNRVGLTLGDECVLGRYLFGVGPTPVGCPPTYTYTFAPTLADTVFIPRVTNIPERYDSVAVPIKMTLTSQTGGIYLTCLERGPGSNDVFTFDFFAIDVGPQDWLSAGSQHSDTVIANIIRAEATSALVDSAVITLMYRRQTSGLGNIAPVTYNRPDPWRIAVEKGGDLYVPVIVYYDFVIPEADTLLVSDSALAFDAYECEMATTTMPVNFTSSGSPITFSVQASDPWIWIEPPTSGLTTPTTIQVTANGAGMVPGVYAGHITLVTGPTAVPSIEAIDVTVTVYESPSPGAIPGDLDCDGLVTMSDLTIMIDHLFITLSSLSSCK